jgi:histidinol-phosphatase
VSEPLTAELLEFALELADAADAVSMEYHRAAFDIATKADGSLVTSADRAVEEQLRALIGARYPSHAVLGEEEGLAAQADAPVRWILDPIDGTHGFARGMPIWATLIAAERRGVLEVGVASAPALSRRWWAASGLGAFVATLPAGVGDADQIRVSTVETLDRAHLLTGSHRQLLDVYGTPAARLIAQVWRDRGVGDFWGHVLVAEGAGDIMLEGSLRPWDIAALRVIVEEAGGRITDLEGSDTLEPRTAVTTNGWLHEAVLAALREGP